LVARALFRNFYYLGNTSFYKEKPNMLKNILRLGAAGVLMLMAVAKPGYAQTKNIWNNKGCAVVLTYDDAIDIDLDHVLPALDSMQFKATFYLIGSSPTISKRLTEWRAAAVHGHELGNHAMFHPCDGSLPGRGFVTADHDLSKYTVARAQEEIRINNTLLEAIDGKKSRTFAFPCGDEMIGGVNFYDGLRQDFAAARGVAPGMPTAATLNLNRVPCYAINGQSAEEMIDLVKQAQKTGTLLVFLFHGVGGGHSLNVSLEAHSKLLHYLKQHEKEIWIAPMVDVANTVSAYQKSVKR
jgi:peptidoglycan/xylan/chitin deacetylase (PgdA/CDA1 family)